MRSLHLCVCLLVSLLLPLSASGGTVQSGVDEQIVRLQNGLQVYVIRDTRFPIVCTRLYVRTGSANEDPELAGISHVLEHMVFKGTESRPKGQIARDVEALGGYLNAATSFDKTWYLTDMPARHWRMGMDVVKDMAFHPSLLAEELEPEKDVIVSELKRGDDSPTQRLYEHLQTSTLANTPYGRPIIGYEKTIRRITVADLKAYINRWYQPQNMLLLVAGDIEPDKVIAHAKDLFGDLRNSGELPSAMSASVVPVPGGKRVEVTHGPWNKVYLGISFPAPALSDLRSIDLDVLSYLLAGDGTSLLARKYKFERQLVDDISVGNMSLAKLGLFAITATLDAKNVAPFWQELTKDLAGLDRIDFGNEAIRRAKLNLEDDFDRSGETLNGLASWRGTLQFDLGGRQGEENVRFAQANVDAGQVKKSIREWLRPDLARVRIFAPQKADLPDFEKVLSANWPQKGQRATVQGDAGGRQASEVIGLGQGRTLVLQPDGAVPYLALNMMFCGGNALVGSKEQGLPSLVARLLMDGCGDMDTQAVQRFMAERATSMTANAGLQTFSLSLTGPSRFAGDHFPLLRKALLKPRFDKGEMRREIGDMKAAIRQRADRPLAWMFAKLGPFLFSPEHPYSFDSLGTGELLDRFSQDTVRNFWKRQLALPWVLTVTGTFDREQVLAFARSLPVPSQGAVVVQAPAWEKGPALDLHLPGRNQAHLLQIFKTVPPTHEDAPALMLLQNILAGQSGLLFTRLRDEQGLGYTVTAFNRNMPEAGYMAFYIGTSPDKLEEARKGFASVAAEVVNSPLPAQKLEAAYNSLLGEYERGHQTLAARAGEAANMKILGLPLDFQRQLIEKAGRLSSAEVQAVAARYLVLPESREVVLTP